jgi:hypothetical protein
MGASLKLSEVKILRTGADGGHLYICGRGELPDHGECEVCAFFRTKIDEQDFERQFCGQSVVVDADAIEFTHGIGGSIREIVSWRLS